DVSFASHLNPSGWPRPRTDRSNEAPPTDAEADLRLAWRTSPTTAITGDEAHGSLYSICPTVLRDSRRPLRPAVRRESLRCMSAGRSLGWLVRFLPTGWWTGCGHRSGDNTGQSGGRPLLGERDFHPLPVRRARASPRDASRGATRPAPSASQGGGSAGAGRSGRLRGSSSRGAEGSTGHRSAPA